MFKITLTKDSKIVDIISTVEKICNSKESTVNYSKCFLGLCNLLRLSKGKSVVVTQDGLFITPDFSNIKYINTTNTAIKDGRKH